MADTQRTKAAILSLLADNVTAQISEQDLRDAIVTIMDEEFLNPGDFFKQPELRKITTDKTCRGWIDYSQQVDSDCSFMNVMYLGASGTWYRADVADSTKNYVIAIALDSYSSGASTCQMLRKGVIYNSDFSAVFSGYIGRPIYLDSGVPGSISIGETANSVKIIGAIEGSDDGGVAIGKWRFDPEWSVKGS